jgi:hypothetical protein
LYAANIHPIFRRGRTYSMSVGKFAVARDTTRSY